MKAARSKPVRSTGSSNTIVDNAVLAKKSDPLEIPQFLRQRGKGAKGAAMSPPTGGGGEHASKPVNDVTKNETNVTVGIPAGWQQDAETEANECDPCHLVDRVKLMTQANAPMSTAFDYASLDQETVIALRAGADRIRSLGRNTVETIIAIGRELIHAKNKLDHGQFGEWLSAEFSMTERTARRYMRAAKVFGDKTDTVSVLQPSTLHLLASPSAPEAVRNEIVDRIEMGGIVSDEVIRLTLKEAKREMREAQRKESCSNPRSASQKDRAARQASDERREEERCEAECAVRRMANLLRQELDHEQLKTFIGLAEIIERAFFGLSALRRLLHESSL